MWKTEFKTQNRKAEREHQRKKRGGKMIRAARCRGESLVGGQEAKKIMV